MNLDDAAIKIATQLMLKVFTPMMAFIYAFFGGIVVAIFYAPSYSPTFNFNAAFWTWLIVALLFTPLLGLLMFLQTVKALGIDYMAIIHMILFKQPPPTGSTKTPKKQKEQKEKKTDDHSHTG